MATPSDHAITRRSLFERVAGLWVAGGALPLFHSRPGVYSLTDRDAVESDAVPLTRKIALEEHFVIPETLASSYGAPGSPELQQRLLDIGSTRIAEMDRGGVDVCILSLVGDGIQAIRNVADAVRIARRANDHLADQIAKNPARFRGFAALPLQDPQAAAQELTRCIRELGFCGALANGYTQLGSAESTVFYDLPQFRDFWATVQQLGVPFYLHPRSAAPQEPAYIGHAWLTGSIWGFAAETSIHALRLIGSGLFDDYPKLQIVIGHLGEGLPCNIWRIDNRVSRTFGGRPKAKMPIGHYLRNNFYITTSGNFRTPTLLEVIAEVGVDRVLYSVDYPFEDTGIAADWFDHCGVGDSDRVKIGRSNAERLFRL